MSSVIPSHWKSLFLVYDHQSHIITLSHIEHSFYLTQITFIPIHCSPSLSQTLTLVFLLRQSVLSVSFKCTIFHSQIDAYIYIYSPNLSACILQYMLIAVGVCEIMIMCETVRFMAKTASHNTDRMVQGKRPHQHTSNCSRFNSISPQFHISPWARGAHFLSYCLPTFRAWADNQAE